MNKQRTYKQNIVLRHRASDCKKLHVFLSDHIRANNIPAEIQHDLRLVIEEIFTNIVKHADIESENNSISIQLSYSAHTINITFKDKGKAFNPICDHENCMDSNDHSEGGMGVHLIKSLTDHQEYKRIEQLNVFTVTKHYNL